MRAHSSGCSFVAIEDPFTVMRGSGLKASVPELLQTSKMSPAHRARKRHLASGTTDLKETSRLDLSLSLIRECFGRIRNNQQEAAPPHPEAFHRRTRFEGR